MTQNEYNPFETIAKNNANSARTLAAQTKAMSGLMFRDAQKESERIVREEKSIEIAKNTMKYNRNSMITSICALGIAGIALIVAIIGLFIK